MHAIALSSVVAVLALMLPAAQGAFDCEKHWSGPSSDNSIADCDLANTYLNRPAVIASIVIPFLLLVFTLIFYPLIFICRHICGCCGNSARRPGHFCCGGDEFKNYSEDDVHRMYSRCDVSCNKACIGVLWFIGMAALFCMVFGSSQMGETYDQFFIDIETLVDWADEQIRNVRTTLTLDNGQLVPGFPEEAFSSASNGTAELRADIKDSKATVDGTIDTFFIVAVSLGVAPIILLIIGTLFAVCDIRRCGPSFLTCFFYLFIIVYASIAVVFLVAAALVTDVCDEIDRQLADPPQPGVFQWWIYPLCVKEVDFGSIQADVEKAELDNSILACQELTNICSPSSVFDLTNPTQVYRCDITNATQQCRSLSNLSTIVNNTVPKTGIVSLCTSVSNSECTPQKCAEDCTVTTIRSYANETISLFGFAERALIAFRDYVTPLVECNNLLNRGLQPFQGCNDIKVAFRLVGGGATIYTIVFILAIGAMFRGQKRFFKYPSDTKTEPMQQIEPAFQAAVPMEEKRASALPNERPPRSRSRSPPRSPIGYTRSPPRSPTGGRHSRTDSQNERSGNPQPDPVEGV